MPGVTCADLQPQQPDDIHEPIQPTGQVNCISLSLTHCEENSCHSWGIRIGCILHFALSSVTSTVVRQFHPRQPEENKATTRPRILRFSLHWDLPIGGEIISLFASRHSSSSAAFFVLTYVVAYCFCTCALEYFSLRSEYQVAYRISGTKKNTSVNPFYPCFTSTPNNHT